MISTNNKFLIYLPYFIDEETYYSQNGIKMKIL